jgi:5-methylthioadenosine/S-adenosylhomocysteine deaminase
VLPDDPGGEAPVDLTAADLGQVEIPPLDSLAHDAAFFAALAAAPILAGRLAGLERYYA